MQQIHENLTIYQSQQIFGAHASWGWMICLCHEFLSRAAIPSFPIDLRKKLLWKIPSPLTVSSSTLLRREVGALNFVLRLTVLRWAQAKLPCIFFVPPGFYAHYKLVSQQMLMAWPMVSKYTVLRKFFKAVLPNWCCVNLLHRSLALLINNKTTSSVLHNTAKSATFLLSKWLSHMQKTSLSMLACGEIIIYARQIGAEHCFHRLMWPQTVW